MPNTKYSTSYWLNRTFIGSLTSLSPGPTHPPDKVYWERQGSNPSVDESALFLAHEEAKLPEMTSIYTIYTQRGPGREGANVLYGILVLHGHSKSKY